MRPVRIEPEFRERVWGTDNLGPWFPLPSKRIGEVWFAGPDNSPLLIKLIYTTERLSVQVHPQDDYAREHHGSNGKTEMWHIVSAQPGAQIGLGLRETVTPQRLRDAALTGEIEQLVNWVDVRAGDTLYAPAGVIHAIGAGLMLWEIQQNSDVTYRLYDYGRPRELHLDHGLKVSALGPYDGRRSLPFASEYFVTEELRWAGRIEYSSGSLPDHYLIVVEGSGRMEEESFSAGQVWFVPEQAGFPLDSDGAVRLLRTYKPSKPR